MEILYGFYISVGFTLCFVFYLVLVSAMNLILVLFVSQTFCDNQVDIFSGAWGSCLDLLKCYNGPNLTPFPQVLQPPYQ